MITREAALELVEFFGMDATPPSRERLIRHDGMQHLVVKDVTQKPQRHERLIERGIDPDDAVFFLDGAENEIILRTMFTPASPHHLITAQASPKVALVQLVENGAQIEVAPFMPQIELALHRQLGMGEFAFRFLDLVRAFRGVHGKVESILVAFGEVTSERWKYFNVFQQCIHFQLLMHNRRLRNQPSGGWFTRPAKCVYCACPLFGTGHRILSEFRSI